MGTRFFAPIKPVRGAHPASCTVGTRSLLGVKGLGFGVNRSPPSRGMTLTPHPLLVPWSRKSRAILRLPLWAVRPVQSLSVCTRVHYSPSSSTEVKETVKLYLYSPSVPSWRVLGQWRTEGEGLGCSNPPLRNSEGPPKSHQTQPDL